MRRLSEIDKKEYFAFCEVCGETFIDDIPTIGSISCSCKKAVLLRRRDWKDIQRLKVLRKG